MRALLTLLLKGFFHVTVIGDFAYRACGMPVLFASNHASRLDALLLALFLPGNPVVIVPASEPQSRLLRWGRMKSTAPAMPRPET